MSAIPSVITFQGKRLDPAPALPDDPHETIALTAAAQLAIARAERDEKSTAPKVDVGAVLGIPTDVLATLYDDAGLMSLWRAANHYAVREPVKKVADQAASLGRRCAAILHGRGYIRKGFSWDKETDNGHH